MASADIFLLTFSLFCDLLFVGGESHDIQRKKPEYSDALGWKSFSPVEGVCHMWEVTVCTFWNSFISET